MSSKDDSLNKREFELMWDACNDEADLLIFVCCGCLGMRASEVANLRRSWVTDGKIKIPYQDEDWKAKTKYAARTIPYSSMNGRVKSTIKKFFSDHERVNLNRGSIWHRVKKIGERTNLNKVYPHALRATAAFQLAEAGISTQALRQIMGWSKLSTAQSYIIQAGRAAEKELEKIGESLW